MSAQFARAEAFRALHARPGIFAIPNPWDAGSARLLAQIGFEALATTSAGFAYSIGRPDGEGALNREVTIPKAARKRFGERLPSGFAAVPSRTRPGVPTIPSTHTTCRSSASRRR